MKHLLSLLIVFMPTLFAATMAHAKPVVDCCASGEDVYEPSQLRIKITHSPELTKQLASLKSKPAELAKMRKAISVGNKLIQGHVNKDLYQYGWEDMPRESALQEEGWQKHFGALVAVPMQEFRAFNSKRGLNESVDVRVARSLHLLCSYSQLNSIQASNDKFYLTYRFVHIARPNTSVAHLLDTSTLDTSQNGKIQTLKIVMNNDFKFLPFESIDSNWWSTYTWGINVYKRDLRGREQTNLKLTEPHKPNLRKLLAQITEAEKICTKPNPFQQ